MLQANFYRKVTPFQIAVLDACNMITEDGTTRPHDYLITRINVPAKHRRKGIATELLTQCIAEADKYGDTLWLEPFSSGEMSRDQLCAWYRKHGFADYQMNGVTLMVRYPARV